MDDSTATVDRVARTLYDKWRLRVGTSTTWDELIDDPTGRDGDHGVAVKVWRDWARAAIHAYDRG